jgi:hypothetical protein
MQIRHEMDLEKMEDLTLRAEMETEPSAPVRFKESAFAQ